MQNQAFLDMVNGRSNVSGSGLLKDIYDSIGREKGYMAQAANSNGTTFAGDPFGNNLRNAAVQERDRQNQLKYLLNAGGGAAAFGGDASAGASASATPFSTGGSGAPTVNTSNRFEPGLSDAEARLKNLLDNPDSITQSAAYKFRVGQGQEALQRSLGAKGLLNSGNRLAELTKYGQDMGSQEYDAQAGRLGSLLGNYSQSWIGDKNANTGLFNAQANAWNQAQANNDRTRLGYAEIAGANQRAALQAQTQTAGRTSSSATPWDHPVYGYGQSAPDAWDQAQRSYATDLALQKARGY